MPRHPPCALDNLTNTPTPATQSSSKPKTVHTRGRAQPLQVKKKDARVHSALDNHTRRPPPPPRNTRSPAMTAQRKPPPQQDGRPLRTQQCTDATRAPRKGCRVVFRLRFHIKPSKQPTPRRTGTTGPPAAHHDRPATTMATRHRNLRARRSEAKLLRKEVIQPHLPVRLPCYDFVPIASPTFDRSPPHGLGHGLRVLPTFVT